MDQFHGIEIEEFPAQIAQVAMWLVDHQMNMLVSEEFGMYFARIPLTSSANIVHGNALRMDWGDVVAPERLNYVMGNPPFVGRQFPIEGTKSRCLRAIKNLKNCRCDGFVTAWYCKAVNFIAEHRYQVAFVSTNSITQGEQVAPCGMN